MLGHKSSHRAAVASSHRIGALTAVLLGALHWQIVAAADLALTLPEAQRLAVARSRQLVAQDAAVTAAREMAVAAGQLPDPVATAGCQQPAGQRSGRVEPDARLHDDAQRRRDAGIHARRKARGAHRALRARSRQVARRKGRPRCRNSARHRARLARSVLRGSDADGDIGAEAARRRSKSRRQRVHIAQDAAISPISWPLAVHLVAAR